MDDYEIICLSWKLLFNFFHLECSLCPKPEQSILLRNLSYLILNGPIQMDVIVLLCKRSNALEFHGLNVTF